MVKVKFTPGRAGFNRVLSPEDLAPLDIESDEPLVWESENGHVVDVEEEVAEILIRSFPELSLLNEGSLEESLESEPEESPSFPEMGETSIEVENTEEDEE